MAVLKTAKKRPVHTPVSRVKKNSDPVIQTYRALFPLNVEDRDGVVRTRQFGDYVPEVSEWRKPGIWLQTRRIEVVHINRSELERWWEEYEERCAEEDEARAAIEEENEEIERLRRRVEELEAKRRGQPVQNNGPQVPQPQEVRNQMQSGQFTEEKIDYGSVRMRQGGVPHAVELPKMTRVPQLPPNTGTNRTRPATVRRAVRKKV